MHSEIHHSPPHTARIEPNTITHNGSDLNTACISDQNAYRSYTHTFNSDPVCDHIRLKSQSAWWSKYSRLALHEPQGGTVSGHRRVYSDSGSGQRKKEKVTKENYFYPMLETTQKQTRWFSNH